MTMPEQIYDEEEPVQVDHKEWHCGTPTTSRLYPFGALNYCHTPFQAITNLLAPSDQTSHTDGCILHTILTYIRKPSIMLFQYQIYSAGIPPFPSPLFPKRNSIQIIISLVHSVPFQMIVSCYFLLMAYSSLHTHPRAI